MAIPPDPSQHVPTISEAASDPQTDVGHYFDQVYFDMHRAMQQAQAETRQMLAELDALGVVIDPDTGAVTFVPRPVPEAK